MPSRTILLVDDSETVRLTLAAVLGDHGHRVEEAASLAEARDRLRDAPGRFDAAVIDLHLPDGLGTALLDEVRSACPRTALVLLSGTTLGGAVAQADLVLDKGLDVTGLDALLEGAIAARRS